MITALDRIYPDHHMNTRVAIGSNIKSSQRSISTAQQTSNPGSNCSLRPERERGKEGNEKLPGREELDGLGNGEGSEGGQEREICENGRRRRRRRWRRRPRCHSRALNHHHHHTLIHLQLNHLSAFSAASKFFFFPLFWDQFPSSWFDDSGWAPQMADSPIPFDAHVGIRDQSKKPCRAAETFEDGELSWINFFRVP